MATLLDVVNAYCNFGDKIRVTKGNFRMLIDSDDDEEVEAAEKALEDNGGYENLPDE